MKTVRLTDCLFRDAFLPHLLLLLSYCVQLQHYEDCEVNWLSVLLCCIVSDYNIMKTVGLTDCVYPETLFCLFVCRIVSSCNIMKTVRLTDCVCPETLFCRIVPNCNIMKTVRLTDCVSPESLFCLFCFCRIVSNCNIMKTVGLTDCQSRDAFLSRLYLSYSVHLQHYEDC